MDCSTRQAQTPEDKEMWLTYHDRNCGELYEMLPVAIGTPMTLLDNADRNPEKRLLKGKTCRVHSVLLHEDEQSRSSAAGERLLSHMPRYICVKFADAQWQLPGTT